MRGAFMWRMGCGFLVFVILVVAFFSLVAWVIGAVTSGDPPWVAVVLTGVFVLVVLAVEGPHLILDPRLIAEPSHRGTPLSCSRRAIFAGSLC